MTVEPCTCQPGDGSQTCPREEECEGAWLDRQEFKRKIKSIGFSTSSLRKARS